LSPDAEDEDAAVAELAVLDLDHRIE